jgi:glycosyltransferase involved in cell wall biosynthesis
LPTSDSKKNKLISILIPVLNEEYAIERAYSAICSLFSELPYEFEIIFTDNHSSDGTLQKLKLIANTDARVKVVRFNRNYGFQRSLFSAYYYSSGAACIQLDCDLQDPPILILQFLKLWEIGHDVVVGIRARRKENCLLSYTRKFFYFIQSKLTEDNMTLNAGDFRLVDRLIVNSLLQINDPNPYIRGIISSLAVNETGIAYERDKRVHGKSKFPPLKLFTFAMECIFGNSLMPLRFASACGLFISFLCIVVGIFYFISALFFGKSWPSGFATNIIVTLFGISMNAIFLGIIGEYLGRIYQQLRNKPLVVVEQTINVTKRKFQ